MCQLLGTSYSRPPIDPYLTSPCYKILAAPLESSDGFVGLTYTSAERSES